MYYFKLTVYFIWMVIFSSFSLIYALIRRGSGVVNAHYGYYFSKTTLGLIGVKVRFEGVENLNGPKPFIIMANHQSGMDVAIFGKLMPKNAVVIGKKELIWVPIFGLFFWAAGNPMIDRKKHIKAVAGLSEALHALKEKGESIWIFPEGTRNRSEDPMLPLKKGGFHMAIAAQVPIIPIVCSALKPIFDAKKRHFKNGTLTIRVLPPISTVGKTEKDVGALVEYTRNEMVKAHLSLPTIVS